MYLLTIRHFLFFILCSLILQFNAYTCHALSMKVPAEAKKMIPGDHYCASFFQYSIFSSRNFFASGSLQLGPVQKAKAGLGMMFGGNNFAMLTYDLGRQEYFGEFLSPFCRDCNYSFHGVWLGAGREFYMVKRRNSGLYISPMAMVGVELVNGRGLIADHDTRLIYNPGVRPQINLGYVFQKFDFFVGVNTIMWLPHARTFERRLLYGETGGEPLRWDTELFPGRSGLGFTAGIKYFFF